jgi:tetratricopeptide (TPR) repeat protein
MHGLTHVEHSSMYQRREDIWAAYAKQRKADFERADGIVGYAWIARYSEAFLDGYLKGDPQGLAFLKKTASENGVPPHFITPSFRAAAGAPTSFASLREQVGREGFDHADEIYTGMLKQAPEFKIGEVEMADWADTLLAIGRPLEAAAVLKLGVRMHPDSADAYELLGDAYRAAGDRAAAQAAYKTAIDKNPDGADDVKRKLAELAAPAR